MAEVPSILVLTPVKDASAYLPGYFAALRRLTWPPSRLALGLLEGDSTDSTWAELEARLPELRARYRRVGLWQKHFGLQLPKSLPRWAPAYQIPRRNVLAKARNHLLSRALENEEWVLWLDVDVIDYRPDIIERLLGYGKDILHPHCVTAFGGPSLRPQRLARPRQPAHARPARRAGSGQAARGRRHHAPGQGRHPPRRPGLPALRLVLV